MKFWNWGALINNLGQLAECLFFFLKISPPYYVDASSAGWEGDIGQTALLSCQTTHFKWQTAVIVYIMLYFLSFKNLKTCWSHMPTAQWILGSSISNPSVLRSLH